MKLLPYFNIQTKYAPETKFRFKKLKIQIKTTHQCKTNSYLS